MYQLKDRRSIPESGERNDPESTLLPMLLGGLFLVVIGAGVVMTLV